MKKTLLIVTLFLCASSVSAQTRTKNLVIVTLDGLRWQEVFWGGDSKKGQIYGNRDLGNNAEVANTFKFSYPRYSELFTSFPDPMINSNDKFLKRFLAQNRFGLQ